MLPITLHAVWSLGAIDVATSYTEIAFCENKYKIFVFGMNKRTGFNLYFNILNIKNRGGAYGSKICGDSGVAVGSCWLESTDVLAGLNDMW